MGDIFIIHSSEVIREGIASLLRQNQCLRFQLYEAFSDAEPYLQKGDSSQILVTEQEIHPSDKIKCKAYNHICISNQTNAVESDTCFDIFSPANELIEQIKSFQDEILKDERRENKLTERETEVLKLLSFGHSNKEIADKLFISIHTVISHRKNITEKLGIKSVSGLTVYAIINNLIDTDGLNPEDLI